MTSQYHYLRKLLADAVACNYTLSCLCEGELDYRDQDVRKALKALTACDEMILRIRDADGKQKGVAFIIAKLAPDEQIADYGGQWMDEWWEKDVR